MIIVVGPPGGGMSEVGAALAREGLQVVDAVDLLHSAGDPQELALTGRLAEAERTAALTALEQDYDVAVLDSGALGNAEGDERGAQVRERITALVAGGAMKVMCDADSKILLKRCGMDVPRIAALGAPRATFLTQLRDRRPLYEADAVRVDTTDADWERVAHEILAFRSH